GAFGRQRAFMRSYEPNLHSLPDGSSSASRLALAAKRLGYSGIIITNHTTSGWPLGVEAARLVGGIEVAIGAEIVASDQRSLHSKATSLRDRAAFLAVHGGDEKINRAA